ncbi:MAG: hypothetical protein WAU45_08785 [Blastocatellia bacterium]
MPLPIATPLAISAIKALLQFRGRVDTILSLKEATAELPFALPPPPTDDAPHLDAMLSFFQSEKGQLPLNIRGAVADFKAVLADPHAQEVQGPRKRLFQLYYEAADVRPTSLGPDSRQAVAGPSTEMRIAYYIVESERLSRNPALTRILLASADTLLEFAGENANLFISNPKTQAFMGTLIEEFAGKRDFDDEGAEAIFKSLLGSTIVAVAQNQGKLADQPALKPLFAAIGDLRDQLGDDFVARIISLDGFESLIGAYATHVAEDPSFITRNELAQKVLAATLKEVGLNLRQLTDDPKALFGVLEVGLTTAAANVSGILERKLGDKPLLAAVLTSLAKEIAASGQRHQVFAGIAHGQLVPALYKATLQAIAANPDKLFGPGKTDSFVAQLVSGVAGALSQQELAQVFTTETLQLLASKSLEVLSVHPELIARNNAFATRLVGAVLKAGAIAFADGLSTDDLLAVIEAAIKTASENVGLINMDDRLAAVLGAIGQSLAEANLRVVLTPDGRKDVLLAALQAIATNPTVWDRLQKKNLVQPIVQNVLAGLATDPSHLLSGPVLVYSIRSVLVVLALRGQQLIDGKVTADTIKQLMTRALDQANQEIGKSIDGENLPDYLRRIVSSYLKAPFPLTGGGADVFAELSAGVLKGLEIV